MAKIKTKLTPAKPGPDPVPKPGDKINLVLAARQETVLLPVVSVPDVHAGRQVIVEVDGRPDKDGQVKKTKLAVPFRAPEEDAALVGLTWHWPAKAALILALLALAFGLTAQAAMPTYRTLSDGGNAASPAVVYFPANPNAQVRVVGVWYTSDTNNGTLGFSTGVTAYTQTSTNATSASVTNLVNSTNGLVAGSLLLLDNNGNACTNTLTSYGTYVTGTNTFGQVTNQAFIVLGTGGWNQALTNAQENIYQMGAISTIQVGSQSNAINGEAIFVGNYGRPVVVTLGPTLVTNRLSSVSAHYDQIGQN